MSRRWAIALTAGWLLLAPARALGRSGTDSASRWTPLHVEPYAAGTYILREDLRATWEAPFLYLLVGDRRALLIDTGDVADPAKMPLASTVLGLLPGSGSAKLPLLVVHSHGHLDHRAGDPQFKNRPGVEVVDADLPHVQRFFGFTHWPDGVAHLDLGGRVVDVLPAPGHHPTEVVFYDRSTGCLFSGDFLLPGRILVDDLKAYEASADRVAAFVRDRPIRAVLGGHIERNRAGFLFPWASDTHPDEAPLALTKADVLALPGALRRFNVFYTQAGGFVIENPIHNLVLGAALCLLVLAALGTLAVRLVLRWRQARRG